MTCAEESGHGQGWASQASDGRSLLDGREKYEYLQSLMSFDVYNLLLLRMTSTLVTSIIPRFWLVA